MRVYVAGSRGLVGSSIMRVRPSLHDVYVTTRSELDLLQPEKVREYFVANGIEAVIFAAAKVGGIFANSRFQKDFLLENLKLQNSVIEAAFKANVGTFIFLGSSCIYPKMADQPIAESSLLTGPLEESNEGYALAKIAGLRLCRAIYEETGKNYFSLMPSNLYGPDDNFDRLTSHVPAALMRRFHEAIIQESNQVTIWGTGEVYREFMHANDLAKACWYFLNMHVGGELINVGTGHEVTIRGFAKLMAEVTGFKGSLDFDISRPDGTPRKLLDVTKANNLGWNSSISLKDGLIETYDWFKAKYAKGEIRGF